MRDIPPYVRACASLNLVLSKGVSIGLSCEKAMGAKLFFGSFVLIRA